MERFEARRSQHALRQFVLGSILAALALAVPTLVALGNGSTNVAQASSAAQQQGCQFAILEFKTCLSGNCAEYEIPLKNTAREPVTVGGRVEFQGPNNTIIATQQLPQTTVPAEGEIIVRGQVCATGALPPGPYKLEVFIQDIPRACEEKHKSQPLSDRCSGAEPTASPTGTVLADRTATATSAPGQTGTPKPIQTGTVPPKPTETGTVLPKPTSTGTVQSEPTMTVTPLPDATRTGTVVIEATATGTTVAGTPEATATTIVFGNSATATAYAGALGQTGTGIPGEVNPAAGRPGMPRTGSSDALGTTLLVIAALSLTVIASGLFMRRRQSPVANRKE